MKRTARTNFQLSPPPSHNLCRRLRRSIVFRLEAEEHLGGRQHRSAMRCLTSFRRKLAIGLIAGDIYTTTHFPQHRLGLHPKTPLRSCTFQTLLADAFTKKADTFAVTGKYAFGAANSLPASNKYEFGATNSLPALDKYKFGAPNSLSAFNKHKSGATNSLSALDKYEFGAANSLPALNKCKFGAQNALSAFDMNEFGAQDAGAGFPARTPPNPKMPAAYAAAEQYGKGVFL